MSQKEFLEELRTALSGKLSAQAVLENIEYYRNYIEGEVRSGKSEAQVLEMLGDPWILAAGGSDYGAYGEETGRQDMHFQELRFPWWKIALIILAVILGIVLVISVITGLIRLLLPVLVPILIVCLIVQFFKGKR